MNAKWPRANTTNAVYPQSPKRKLLWNEACAVCAVARSTKTVQHSPSLASGCYVQQLLDGFVVLMARAKTLKLNLIPCWTWDPGAQ